jgi:hypothetical protein
VIYVVIAGALFCGAFTAFFHMGFVSALAGGIGATAWLSWGLWRDLSRANVTADMFSDAPTSSRRRTVAVVAFVTALNGVAALACIFTAYTLVRWLHG